MRNDPYGNPEFAKMRALMHAGGEIVVIGRAGHVEQDSNLSIWTQGLQLLNGLWSPIRRPVRTQPEEKRPLHTLTSTTHLCVVFFTARNFSICAFAKSGLFSFRYSLVRRK